MILNDFDASKIAIINPLDIVGVVKDMPETVVTFFEHVMFDRFVDEYKPEIIGKTGVASKTHYVYKIVVDGKPLALVQAGVGAPYSVGIFEEVVAMGAKNILMFGSCGVLKDIEDNSIIIPNAAVRDEGTSYHYQPASDEIELDPKLVNKLIEFFEEKQINYTVGKTWTTDAFFRETTEKTKKRVDSGCICVDMECSAMAAFAKFRNINFAEFFFAADNLSKEKWEPRVLSGSFVDTRFKILSLAIECALTIF